MFKGYDKFTLTNGGESYANYLEHEQRIQGKGSVMRHGVYLAHEEKMEIRYIGNICERVGWKEGEVLKVEEWEPVAKNRHAITGEQLTKEHSKRVKQEDGSVKTLSDRKMHCDTTVSMPKTFSLLYALAGEHRVVDWHHQALKKGLGEWSKIIGCQANGRSGAEDHMEITGKYAGTQALHFFSRNGDPNIHSHVDIANVTEGANKKLYAIDFRNLMDHYGYLTAVYRDELSRLAREAGYEVVKGQYEEPQIASLLDMCSKYSSRSEEIDEVVLKIETATGRKLEEFEKDFIVRATRGLDWEKFEKLWAAKKPTLRSGLDSDVRRETLKELVDIVKHCSNQKVGPESADQLLEKVLAQMTAEEIQTCQRAVKVEPPKEPLIRRQLSESIEYAIEHMFQGRSVVKERDLWKTVINRSQGAGVDLTELRDKIASHRGIILGAHNEVASSLHYRRELETDNWIQEGKGRGVEIPYDKEDLLRLSPLQRKAVESLLDCDSQFSALSGSSGVGKTEYVLAEIIKANVAAGYRVAVVAPSDGARDVLHHDAGKLAPGAAADALSAAVSLQLYQADPKLHQQLGKNDLLIVDEASFVSLQQGHTEFGRAIKSGVRVLLVGDVDQGQSIEAGEFFRMTMKMGIHTAELHDIRRQSAEALDGHYLKAIQLFKQGKTTAAFQELLDAGCIHEITGQARVEAIADRILQSKKEGIASMCSNFTHRENEAIAECLRGKMKELGQLRDERILMVYGTLGWTDAQKKDVSRIEPGMVLEILRGKDKGEAWTVIDRLDGNLYAKNSAGEVRTFTKAHHKLIDVCQQRELPVAIGDDLFARSANKRGKVINGARLNVAGWEQSGNPIDSDGRSIEHRNLCHAYASTSRKVQGSSTTHIITGFDRQSVTAATRDVPYVINGRGREFCDIYVESITDLSQIENRSPERKGATQMAVRENQPLPADLIELSKQIEQSKAPNHHPAPERQAKVDLQENARKQESQELVNKCIGIRKGKQKTQHMNIPPPDYHDYSPPAHEHDWGMER